MDIDLGNGVETIEECRVCASDDLSVVLDLGHTPIAYRLLDEAQLNDPEPHFPLQVALCHDCRLAQLKHAVNPQLLYPPDYPYDMETTQSAIDHFHSLASDAAEEAEMEASDLAVDIGSSTGVLLQGFEKANTEVLGIEPATEMADRAEAKGIETLSEFFDVDLAADIREQYGPATIITATNVINQIDDLPGFVDGIETLLAEGGMFVFETPHLVNTIEDLHYDHIYHEHSTYLSIEPIERLMAQQGMHITRIEKVDFRGGSLRCYVGREDETEKADNIDEIRAEERDLGIDDLQMWESFAGRVYHHRDQLNELVYSLKRDGHSIAAISVTAKGNSMLNFCGFSKHDFEFVTEIMDTKIGKYTPGGHIPILHDDVLLEETPDYALIMAWNYADTIIENLDDYQELGGKFIVPMPEPEIVE